MVEGRIDPPRAVADERPEAIRRVHVDAMLGLRGYHVRRLTGTLPAEAVEGASDVLRRLWTALRETDATLVEVNPLVLLSDGRVVALDPATGTATLADGRPYLVGDTLTLADFALTPCMTSLSRHGEGQDLLQRRPRIVAWRERLDATPAVTKVRVLIAPHLDTPIEHAREWVKWHRPRY